MYNGQRALQAAVTSSALQASNFKAQLDLILTPLITTLSRSKNPANALAQRYLRLFVYFFLFKP